MNDNSLGTTDNRDVPSESKVQVMESKCKQKSKTKKKSNKKLLKVNASDKFSLKSDKKNTVETKNEITKECGSEENGKTDVRLPASKKSFSGVDGSLKELCDMDKACTRNDTVTTSDAICKSAESEKVKVLERSTVSESSTNAKNDSLDDLYTFSEPPTFSSDRQTNKKVANVKRKELNQGSKTVTSKKSTKLIKKCTSKTTDSKSDQTEVTLDKTSCSNTRSLRQRHKKKSYKEIDESFEFDEDSNMCIPDSATDSSQAEIGIYIDKTLSSPEDTKVKDKTENVADDLSLSTQVNAKKPKRKSRVSFNLTEQIPILTGLEDSSLKLENNQSWSITLAKTLSDTIKHKENDLSKDDRTEKRKSAIPVAEVIPRTASSVKSYDSSSLDSLILSCDNNYSPRAQLSPYGRKIDHFNEMDGYKEHIKEERRSDLKDCDQKFERGKIKVKSSRKKQSGKKVKTVNDKENCNVQSDDSVKIIESENREKKRSSEYSIFASSKVVKQKKSTVFPNSYTKAKHTFLQPDSKMQRYCEKRLMKDKSYDPYDFVAQSENSSMKSERTKRPDISKHLNRRQKQKLEERCKSEQIMEEKIDVDLECEITRVCDLGGKVSETGGFLDSPEEWTMVQDKKTNKWYRKPRNEKAKIKEETPESLNIRTVSRSC